MALEETVDLILRHRPAFCVKFSVSERRTPVCFKQFIHAGAHTLFFLHIFFGQIVRKSELRIAQIRPSCTHNSGSHYTAVEAGDDVPRLVLCLLPDPVGVLNNISRLIEFMMQYIFYY